MLDKLKDIESRFEEINLQLSDPAVISNQEKYVALMKELNDISQIVKVYREYAEALKGIDDVYLMLKENSDDPDFKQMLQDELHELEDKKPVLEQKLKILLLPADPNDEKNVIIEIRGGAGGDEAALFASSLLRMYTMYAETKKWKTEILDINEIGIGGIKEVVFLISGNGAYSRFKYERGVHRVQRVPETESQGRIHTSTVTVAVLPEVEDVDVDINLNDVQVDTYRSSGAGGQHVNKTDSAIRLTHIPTGIVVACQDERSQHKNKEKAFKILRSKLYEMAQENQDKEIAQNRKSQVGTGDRSERIRTYNFPQGRVTDHRIGLTLYKIEAIMNGDLDDLMDALITEDQARKLSNQNG
ncbi:MAG: peptide chain release factor 1 [Clostridia bacterium]|jgi:peptide chain release factor 1|nr:peptide chain release factor 1 [Clostridia bacterium]NLV33741.1 peptide chain release factor 1 [Clostridiaceae bacterium]OQB53619.1 MAG: Peptide chain release factor 1 [Firmicutes bacterium ADurb.Bin146]MDD4501772.1 peptide chain release factor 1 [Clostridia bacterium]HPB16776.1 peptide chain release factor 1 [Clostridia bacterium]